MTAVAVFGDTAPPTQARVAEAVARTHPDAVVFLGDAVDRHGRWAARRGLKRWVRDLAPLRGRLFAIGGNHDFEADGGLSAYSAALDELDCPPARRQRFCVEFDGIRLVGLTVGHHANAVSHEDLRWCADAFADTPAGAAKVVAVHQPLFPIAGRIGVSLDADPARRDDFLAALRGWRVNAVVCGHEHLYARRWIGEGLLQIGSGGGGRPEREGRVRPRRLHRRPAHFVTLTPVDGALGIAAWSPDGEPLDRFTLELAA